MLFLAGTENRAFAKRFSAENPRLGMFQASDSRRKRQRTRAVGQETDSTNTPSPQHLSATAQAAWPMLVERGSPSQSLNSPAHKASTTDATPASFVTRVLQPSRPMSFTGQPTRCMPRDKSLSTKKSLRSFSSKPRHLKIQCMKPTSIPQGHLRESRTNTNEHTLDTHLSILENTKEDISKMKSDFDKLITKLESIKNESVS